MPPSLAHPGRRGARFRRTRGALKVRKGRVDHFRVKRSAWAGLAASLVLGVLALAPEASAAAPAVVGMATTPSGNGHWVVDAAGGVRTDGDAAPYGSLAGRDLNQAIVGMAATPTGHGYWLVARDGGIFGFGDAPFKGSTGAIRLNQPIVGMAATPTGHGYWLAAGDGGIFTFGDATFKGAGSGRVTAVAGGTGYALATAEGKVAAFRASPGRPHTPAPTTTVPPATTTTLPPAPSGGGGGGTPSPVTTPAPPTTTTVPAPEPPVATRVAGLWPFASTSPWNMPIGSGAGYQAATDAKTATLLDTGKASAWVNAEQYSHPVYQASATDPMVTVRRAGFVDVTFRLPLGAAAAAGSDRHLHVVAPDGRWLDEDWNVQGVAPLLTTGYHVRTDLYGPGVGQGGVRAYGGSAIGGLIRTWELDQGAIGHAIAIAIDGDQLGQGPVWPATAEDGDAATSYTGNVPMGTLAAIPPSVDVDGLGLTATGRAVAHALQDYGAYVVDRSGCVCLYAEPSASTAKVGDLRHDVARLRSLLRVVTNSGPAAVGGPGTRRAPLAPALP
ncbi:MAG: hypothetical protein JWO68_942 [Actinomycetia bacterium]|nr:hypothetical protein [Actinomycetes bacterium]